MHFYGSVLVVLVFLLETHAHAESYGERLETVWRHCKQYYKENSVDKPSRFTNMRIGMFTRESCWRNMFPKLKGRAAEVKHFGPALMKAFATMMDTGNDDHHSIHLALQMSVNIDRILDDYPDAFTLPPREAERFQGAVFIYLKHLTSLASRFNSRGRMVFNITVKTHCLAHIGCRVHCLNPRRAWCFSGERFMLIQRKIVASCSRGTKLEEMNAKFLHRYRYALHSALILRSILGIVLQMNVLRLGCLGG